MIHKDHVPIDELRAHIRDGHGTTVALLDPGKLDNQQLEDSYRFIHAYVHRRDEGDSCAYHATRFQGCRYCEGIPTPEEMDSFKEATE